MFCCWLLRRHGLLETTEIRQYGLFLRTAPAPDECSWMQTYLSFCKVLSDQQGGLVMHRIGTIIEGATLECIQFSASDVVVRLNLITFISVKLRLSLALKPT